jgi:sugar/nucleoside kinase (ribokinase family)
VIGDVMLDVVAAPQGPIATGADTPATIALVPGGSGANVAAWLGHLGASVRFAGRAGSDSQAWHVAQLRAHGVEPVLAIDPDLRTGVLVSLISAGGERSFLTDRGANARLCHADLPDALLDGIGLVHFSGYALAHPETRAAVMDFLAGAADRAIPIAVDPGATSFLREAGPASFLDWTRNAQLCFPNAAEAALLAGTADLDAALAILGRHYAVVAIKNGADAALACADGGTRRWRAAPPPARSLDSTGAGDAFVAGFLTAYVRCAEIPDCLRAGVDAGARAVARFGGRPPPRA